MTIAATVYRLAALGVQVVAPEPGRIKLATDAAEIPAEAIEIAKPMKADLLHMLERSADLPPCGVCGGPMLAVPTFDGFENFECMRCDRCSGCRRIQIEVMR
jgi:hypothetical protein